VRDIRGLSASTQLLKLRERGVEDHRIWVEQRTSVEGLEQLLKDGLRAGDTLEVCRVAVLAEPKQRKGDTLPRRKLRKVIDRLKEIGVRVYEVETDRHCSDPDALLDMVFDAIEQLAGEKKQKAGAGRPKSFKTTPEQLLAARAVWFNTRDYEDNDAAVAELNRDLQTYGGPWTANRGWKVFGGSGRQAKGRPPAKDKA
jgi:hypothetical protein